MTSSRRITGEHVGELMSGYIDGELTQQQRQRVEIHCNGCPECRNEVAELRELRRKISSTKLSHLAEDTWRETIDEIAIRSSRGTGWLFVIGGALVMAGIGIYDFLIDSSILLPMKIAIAVIYGGLAMPFVSVLHQRLIERKTDKYKDVEI